MNPLIAALVALVPSLGAALVAWLRANAAKQLAQSAHDRITRNLAAQKGNPQP